MNTNFENLPVVIFDWVETLSFESLSSGQRAEVLRWISKEDYEELHRTSSELKHLLAPEPGAYPRAKQKLLGHFDAHQEKARYSPRQIVWQAAAILLLMLCGWLFYQVFDLRSQRITREMAVTDTVYVDREIRSDPEIVHDTIYKYREFSQEKKQETQAAEEVTDRLNVFTETEIPPVMDPETFSNTPRGTSMKDDSLLRRFGFVAM